MGAITEAGYDDIRAYINDSWAYIELQDASGVTILRIQDTDPRITRSASDAQDQTVQITLNGDDTDIAGIGLPITFGKSALFKAGSGGSALSEETYTEGVFVMGSADDELTITHHVEVPEIT